MSALRILSIPFIKTPLTVSIKDIQGFIHCLFRPRHCFKYQAVQRKCYFDMIFLFHKRIIILIGNLKQYKSSLQNANKPEVLVIFSKGQCIVLKSLKVT